MFWGCAAFVGTARGGTWLASSGQWGNQLYLDPPRSSRLKVLESARFPARTRPAEVFGSSSYSQGRRFESRSALRKAPLIRSLLLLSEVTRETLRKLWKYGRLPTRHQPSSASPEPTCRPASLSLRRAQDRDACARAGWEPALGRPRRRLSRRTPPETR